MAGLTFAFLQQKGFSGKHLGRFFLQYAQRKLHGIIILPLLQHFVQLFCLRLPGLPALIFLALAKLRRQPFHVCPAARKLFAAKKFFIRIAVCLLYTSI